MDLVIFKVLDSESWTPIPFDPGARKGSRQDFGGLDRKQVLHKWIARDLSQRAISATHKGDRSQGDERTRERERTLSAGQVSAFPRSTVKQIFASVLAVHCAARPVISLRILREAGAALRSRFLSHSRTLDPVTCATHLVHMGLCVHDHQHGQQGAALQHAQCVAHCLRMIRCTSTVITARDASNRISNRLPVAKMEA